VRGNGELDTVRSPQQLSPLQQPHLDQFPAPSMHVLWVVMERISVLAKQHGWNCGQGCTAAGADLISAAAALCCSQDLTV